MDSRPVGVFDSGLGGLTALRRLCELLPNEDVIYLGDTGRVPYGSRSPETIRRYAREDVRFLLSRGVKAVVVACNTVSSAALDDVRALAGDVPVFDVVAPPSKLAAETTRNGKIGVLGTAATVRSGAYAREIARVMPDAQTMQIACPLFVPLVENGRTDENDAAVRAIASDYLAPLIESGADTVLLGCTHYPLLRDALAKILGDNVALIDSGAAAAEAAADGLRALGILSPDDATGTRSYFVTDVPEEFAALAARFLQSDVQGSVRRISLESENTEEI